MELEKIVYILAIVGIGLIIIYYFYKIFIGNGYDVKIMATAVPPQDVGFSCDIERDDDGLPIKYNCKMKS